MPARSPAARARSRCAASAAFCVLGLAIAGPAVADWLVLRDGGKVETRGPWRERGKLMVFTDADGVRRSLPAAEVDLEASREATAVDRRPPPVILYSTRWCGWCRRTRSLLGRLEVPFVEKDIEVSDEARAEHEAKAGPGAGVPVLDIGGKIVRGFNAEAIQSLVGRRLQPSGASPPR